MFDPVVPKRNLQYYWKLSGGKTSNGRQSATARGVFELLWLLLASSPGRARAEISCLRTCSCATNSPSSPVAREPDRLFGFAPGTSCGGCWRAGFVPAGAST